MFAPSQNDVRRFFCATHAKRRDGAPLTPMEALAADWIAEHPEYHAELDDVDPGAVDEVVMGNVLQAGVGQGRQVGDGHGFAPPQHRHRLCRQLVQSDRAPAQ